MHKLFLSAAVALACAAAANAQNPTSSNDTSIRPARSRGDVGRSDPLFRRTVECVVERAGPRTRNLIATIPGTADEARIISSFQSRLDWCFDAAEGGISFPWNVMRGGIAEVFYHRAFPAGLPATPATPSAAAATAWAQPRAAAFASSEGAQMEMLHSVARCVVVRQPATVSTLLAAAPLSAGEGAAMRTLQPDLSACLTSGITFTASRQSLRGLLAEAALHYGEDANGGFVRVAQAPAASD
ncbi:MAG TPA: hypothetical protein VIT38_02980 [Allosphingosinicella sp.]